MSKVKLRKQLEEWLDMSLNTQMPSVILVLSRAFALTANKRAEIALRDSLSSLPDEVHTPPNEHRRRFQIGA